MAVIDRYISIMEWWLISFPRPTIHVRKFSKWRPVNWLCNRSSICSAKPMIGVWKSSRFATQNNARLKRVACYRIVTVRLGPVSTSSWSAICRTTGTTPPAWVSPSHEGCTDWSIAGRVHAVFFLHADKRVVDGTSNYHANLVVLLERWWSTNWQTISRVS